MSDESKVISLLIVCAAIVAIVCTNIWASNTQKYIEAGYVQRQRVGSEGIYWVKP